MKQQKCGTCPKIFSKGQLKFKVKGRTSMWYKEAEVCYRCYKLLNKLNYCEEL